MYRLTSSHRPTGLGLGPTASCQVYCLFTACQDKRNTQQAFPNNSSSVLVEFAMTNHESFLSGKIFIVDKLDLDLDFRFRFRFISNTVNDKLQ